MYKKNIDEDFLQNNFNKNKTKQKDVFKLSSYYLNNISYNTRKINSDFLVKNKMNPSDKITSTIVVKDIVDTKTPVTMELFHQNSEKLDLHKERDFIKNDVITNYYSSNESESSDIYFLKHNISHDLNLGSEINNDNKNDLTHFEEPSKEYNINLNDNSFVKQHIDISVIPTRSLKTYPNLNDEQGTIDLNNTSFVKQPMDISIIPTNNVNTDANLNNNNQYLNINNPISNRIKKKFPLENNNLYDIEVSSNSHFIPIDKTFIKNINSNVVMNGFIHNTNFKSSSNKSNHSVLDLYLKKIKIINNVYQEKYFGNVNATGFGDFIRGCYFLMSFCETYRFSYRIIINHPIQKFLKHKHSFSSQDNDDLFKNISMFTNNNWKESIFDSDNYIVNVKTDSNIINDFINYIYDAITDNNDNNKNIFIYTIAFPLHKLIERHKKYMRALLVPSDEMKVYVDNVINKIGLVKKNYIVIHIRSGDNYLKQETTKFTNNYVKNLIHQIKRNISKIKDSSSQNFLLISDNNRIKKIIVHEFGFFKTVINSITHLGEGILLNDTSVKNTLLDFYLFSNASSIMSFSSYKHGSGFSYWCAKTYDIPYSCQFIE